MREFIEDAHQHRDDGYGRAQAHVRRELPKRFYKQTGVSPVDGGFAVTLDGKPTRTPGMKPVVVPVAPLATAMAAEWAAQGEFIDPATMPLVRLVNSAIESGEERVIALREEVVKYAGNDLLLYRTDTPQELVAEQERLWDSALVRIARHFGVGFQPTIGIIHQGRLLEELEAEQIETLRSRRLEIQARHIEQAQNVLLQAGYAVKAGGEGLCLYEARALDAPDDVAALLFKAGVFPTRLAVEQEDLEDYFLRLTGEKS